MTKYNSENERVKRDYVTHMRLAQGKQEGTIMSALGAIDRFEKSTGYRSFKAFHVEQAKAFREKILNQPGARGQEKPSPPRRRARPSRRSPASTSTRSCACTRNARS
jgi:hypothetical protein